MVEETEDTREHAEEAATTKNREEAPRCPVCGKPMVTRHSTAAGGCGVTLSTCESCGRVEAAGRPKKLLG